MSKHALFPVLRKKLDDAITYGTKKEALALAREGLRKAKLAKSAGETEYFKAQLHIIKNNFATAIGHLDLAIAHNPADGAAFNDRALCMVELGIIDEAFSFFDRGIAVEPDYATIYHNKGWLLNNIGRHTEAIRCLRKALELEPGRAVTYDNLADAQMNLGNRAGALESYRKVLRLLKPRECPGIRKQICERIKSMQGSGE
jgi:tetratricopeptide (TPR) repeat protein